MSGMMAAFQAQISDLSAKVNLGSSSLMLVASSVVTELTTVRPKATMPMASSVETNCFEVLGSVTCQGLVGAWDLGEA